MRIFRTDEPLPWDGVREPIRWSIIAKPVALSIGTLLLILVFAFGPKRPDAAARGSAIGVAQHVLDTAYQHRAAAPQPK